MPIKINGATSGSTTITAPNTGSDETIELSTALAAKAATADFPNTAWTTFTPTWSGITVNNATVTAAYQKLGKVVLWRVSVIFGNATAVTGVMSFTPPVSAKNGTQYIHQGFATDASAGTEYELMIYQDATAVYLKGVQSNGAYASPINSGATIPFTWANTDYFYINGYYEAA